MSVFEKLKVLLKQKWLNYYETNRSWIKKVNMGWERTPDGGRRPNSPLILGAINAVEPNLAEECLLTFCHLNTDPNKLVEALGLNFDPEIELKKREAEGSISQEAQIVPSLPDSDTEYLKKLREENSLQ